MTGKTREQKARRAAQRQGLRLERARFRDVRAVGYGTYRLVDIGTNAVVASGPGSGYDLTLDEIEETLGARA